jgi:uncharacterized delta-60 repeat protein
MKLLLLALTLLLVPAGSALAAPADLDSGGAEEAEAVAVQPDGRIVVAGHTSVGSNAAVYRLNPSGSFDTTFDGDGAVGIDGGEVEGALALALQPNGRIVVGGWTTVNDNAAVFRLKGV